MPARCRHPLAYRRPRPARPHAPLARPGEQACPQPCLPPGKTPHGASCRNQGRPAWDARRPRPGARSAAASRAPRRSSGSPRSQAAGSRYPRPRRRCACPESAGSTRRGRAPARRAWHHAPPRRRAATPPRAPGTSHARHGRRRWSRHCGATRSRRPRQACRRRPRAPCGRAPQARRRPGGEPPKRRSGTPWRTCRSQRTGRGRR